jgi:Ca2+/H+ antiporter
LTPSCGGSVIESRYIAGFFGTIAILVVFYELFASPVVGVSSGSIVSSFIVVLVYLFGFALYYGAKMYNKKQGIDLGFVFKEIPPE